jgi:hypothetical protein
MWIILTYDENGWDLLSSNKKECLALTEDSENEDTYPCHTEDKFIDDMEWLNIEVNEPDELHSYEINAIKIKLVPTGLLIIPEGIV